MRDWSHGEVTAAKTVLPPTSKKEMRYHPDGLFSERIFGCQFDWECDCGKLSGKHHQGKRCKSCGVKVTLSAVRRRNMGHIALAAPVVHPWFLKSSGSPLAALLGAELTALKQVVYYDRFVVLDPGETRLRERELLTDQGYLKAREQYGDAFRADTGASAVQELLKRLDLEDLCRELRAAWEAPDCPEERRQVLAERLRVAEPLRQSGNQPEWLVLRDILVIPPDLRPMVPLDRPLRGNRAADTVGREGQPTPAYGSELGSGGAGPVTYTDRFRTTGLNELYRRVIECNNLLRASLKSQKPESLLRAQKR
jgi:DNA-directed RNA polymerase subunit beta'